MTHPTILSTILNATEQIKLFKICSNYGHHISYKLGDHKQNQFLIIISELENLSEKLYLESPTILAISKFENETDLNKFELDIDKEVYFMDWNSLNVYEVYTINKMHIKRYLGYFQMLHDNLSFIEAKNYNPSFVKRRENFHGIQFKGNIYF